jgi:hypothetical protein
MTVGIIPPKKHSVSMNIEIKDSTNKLAKKRRSGEDAVEPWNRAYNLERS